MTFLLEIIFFLYQTSSIVQITESFCAHICQSSSSSGACPWLERSSLHEVPPACSILSKSPCSIQAKVERQQACFHRTKPGVSWATRGTLPISRTDTVRALLVSSEGSILAAYQSYLLLTLPLWFLSDNCIFPIWIVTDYFEKRIGT